MRHSTDPQKGDQGLADARKGDLIRVQVLEEHVKASAPSKVVHLLHVDVRQVKVARRFARDGVGIGRFLAGHTLRRTEES